MCRANGIRQEYSAPYTPEENGKIERVWGTVTGRATCMLETAGLPKQLWPYALATSYYVKNLCFHSVHNSTLYGMFFGERPNLSEMQPFERGAFVLTEDRKKLHIQAQTGIFLGYSSRSKCFIVCTEGGTPERKPSKICASKNVTFKIQCFPGGVTSVATDMTHDRCGTRPTIMTMGSSPDVEQVEVADELIPNTGHLDEEDDHTQPQRNEPGRQRRNVRLPRRLDDFVMGDELENLALHSLVLVASTVPGSAAEALGP